MSASASLSLRPQVIPGPDPNNTTGRKAIVAVDKVGAKVRFYGAADHAEIKAIDTEKYPHEVAVSPDHRYACVSIYGLGVFGNNPQPGKSIEVFDLEAMERSARVSIEPFFAPHALVFDPSGMLWVSCDSAQKLLCVDPVKGRVEEAYDTGSKGSHFIVMTPDAAKIYVSNKGDDLGVFDMHARRFTATLQLPRGSEGVAVTPDGRYVAAADNETGQVLHLIETASDRIVERVPLEGVPPSNPRRSRLMRPRFSPDGRFLIVTNYASGTVHVMETTDLREQSLLAVAKGPMGAAFSPDGARVLISNHDNGIVTVIDLAARRIDGWFEGGEGIETLCYY
jgi:DNA-binding beta-propeller fold protein YncE